MNSGHGFHIASLLSGFYHLVPYARSTVPRIRNEGHRAIEVPQAL